MPAGAYENTRALRSDLERFVAMVSAAADLSAPVPRLRWTAGQTVAHATASVAALGAAVVGDVAGVTPIVAAAVQPDGPHVTQGEAVAPVNEVTVRHVRPPKEAAAGLLASGEALLAAIPGSAPEVDRPTPWYGPGKTRTAGTLAAAGHGELLVHGLDVARALGLRWPIPPESAGPVIATTFRGMAPYLVTAAGRAFRGVVDVRILGVDRFTFEFAGGAVTVGEPRRWRDVTYRVSMTPEAALMVGYGRASLWSYVVRGAIRPGGPQAWRAVGFERLLAKP